MTIRRSKSVLLVFLGGYGMMLVLGFMHSLGVIHIDGASTWISRGVMLGFILPAFAYFCFLWSRRDLAILSVSRDKIEMRSGIFLNRSLRIPKSSIEKITTDWKGPNSDSPSNLIFVLNAEATSLAESSSVLRFKQGGWSFDISNADISPSEAVKLLRINL